MKSLFTLLPSLFISISSFSQNIMAFVDYQKKLQVFEDGVFRQAEYMPVQSFKVGQDCIAYIDNMNEFNIYYKGEKTDIAYASNIIYKTTRDLLIYQNFTALSVFENGEKTTLTSYIGKYSIGDSLVGFYDDYARTLKVYYKGKISELGTNFFNPPDTMLAGANTLIYIDPTGYLKIYYNGVVKDLGTNAATRFAAGSDIAAYVDDNTQFFKVFYKGEVAKLETFAPKSFKCGDRTVAYIDNTGSFKILSDGILTTVKSSEPDSFIVKHNLVFYSFNGIFTVFYNGQPIDIERNVLTNYQISNSSLAYLNDLGNLRLFHDGKVEDISIEPPTAFLLRGNVLWYKLGNNDDKIYYKGRTY